MEKEIAIKVDHVSKYFKVPTEATRSMRTALVNWVKGIRGYRKYDVLKDISFEIEKGDFFGIVGRNGSGKSTLLKIISKIYRPNSGTVTANGKIVPFIELGVGFNEELSGHDNVYLNGAMLGFTDEEIDAMYDEIVAFAELEDFMDQKLKNYSSGMQVRLAFSVAIKAKGDILILDEVLAVGDEAFQRKCDLYFREIKGDKSKTVILVTHNMSSVQQYCNKAIMIEGGEIIALGNSREVSNEYSKGNFSKKGLSHLEQTNKSSVMPVREREMYQLGLNENVPLFKVRPISNQILTNRDKFCKFSIELELSQKIRKPVALNIQVVDEISNSVIFADSRQEFVKSGKFRLIYSFPLEQFLNVRFTIRAQIKALYKNQISAHKKEAVQFEILAYTNEDNSARFFLNKKVVEQGIIKNRMKIIVVER